MRDLLLRRRDGTLSRGDRRELVRLHHHYFGRRVVQLGASYFPGTEKSEAAIASLANGAFASFEKEPFRKGLPAFEYALTDRFENPIGILYYWQGSATMDFIQREGPPVLAERRKLMRNVHLALRGRASCGRRGAEPLYGDGPEGRPELDRIDVDLRGVKTPEAVDRILRAAGCPLTEAEICAVLVRISGFLDEHPRPPDLIDAVPSRSDSGLSGEVRVLDTETERVVRRFFYERLDPEERRLLVDRGYASDGRPVPFDRVAAAGPRSKEWYRTTERQIFEAFRELLEPEEYPAGVECLIRLLQASTDGAEL